jgi:ABC-type antimicrobial peptide transport system permease subunit
VLLFPAVRLVQGMLYGVSAFDPVTWIAAAAVLIAVALVAALLPALRAASVDPMQALRAE